jgi:transposase
VSFIEGLDRAQVSLLPPSIEDYVASDSLVRVVDAFVDSLDLNELGFERTVAADKAPSTAWRRASTPIRA